MVKKARKSIVIIVVLLLVTSPVVLAQDMLTVLHWKDISSSEFAESEIIAQFEEETGIKVNFMVLPLWQYWEKLLPMVMTGTAPDIIFVHSSYVEWDLVKYVGMDLRPFAEGDPEYDLDDFVPAFVDLCTDEQGRLLGIPTECSLGEIIMWNPELLGQAGLVTPPELWEQGQWTWDALAETARKLTIRDASGRAEQIGFSQMGSPSESMWKAWGVKIADEAQENSLLYSPETIQWLTWVQEQHLNYDWMVSEKDILEVFGGYGGGELSWNQFATGKLAMFTQNLRTNFDTVDVVPMPMGPAGKAATVMGVWATVNKDCNVEAAWDLLRRLTDKNMEARKTAIGDWPQRLSYADVFFAVQGQKVDHIYYYMDMLTYAEPRVAIRMRNWANISNGLTEAWKMLVNGTISPEDAARRMHEHV